MMNLSTVVKKQGKSPKSISFFADFEIKSDVEMCDCNKSENI